MRGKTHDDITRRLTIIVLTPHPMGAYDVVVGDGHVGDRTLRWNVAVIADLLITRPAASAASDVTGRTPGEIFILTCKILCSCVILHLHCKLDIEYIILIKCTFSLLKPADSFSLSTFSINSPRKVQGGGAQHHVQCQPRVIITLR